jgi:endonuclease YncB( thermonuclease family)
MNGRWCLGLLLAANCMALAAAADAPRLRQGTVSRVSDGDTLWLRPAGGGKPLKLRMKGIDAPELCQAGGPESRQALEQLALHREVQVEPHGRDDHGRVLGVLRIDGEDLGARLVRDGRAWSYRYRGDPGPYAAEERSAQAQRRGLHADGAAVRPYEFRVAHGPCKEGEVAAPAGATQ